MQCGFRNSIVRNDFENLLSDNDSIEKLKMWNCTHEAEEAAEAAAVRAGQAQAG